LFRFNRALFHLFEDSGNSENSRNSGEESGCSQDSGKPCIVPCFIPHYSIIEDSGKLRNSGEESGCSMDSGGPRFCLCFILYYSTHLKIPGTLWKLHEPPEKSLYVKGTGKPPDCPASIHIIELIKIFRKLGSL